METRTPKIPGREHPITIEPAGQRIIVRVGGRIVADTTAALTLYSNAAAWPSAQSTQAAGPAPEVARAV